jgi:hypothetical protein
MTTTTTKDASSFSLPLFPNALPVERLGKEHASLESFRQAVYNLGGDIPRRAKEYSLVIVLEPHTQRILLGRKHRGFGAGFYNSFGGKLEMDETDAQSAVRELEEETGIDLRLSSSSSSSFDMAQHKVGTMHFTFEDDAETEMVVHIFCIHVSCHITEPGYSCGTVDENASSSSSSSSPSSGILQTVIPLDASVIRGCDEISPVWFDNWYDIPLHEMFADDSIWLTRLLSHYHHDDTNNNGASSTSLAMDGWFHFAEGGQEENRILHHYLSVKTHGSSSISSPSDSNGIIHAISHSVKDHHATRIKNATTNIPTTSNCTTTSAVNTTPSSRFDRTGFSDNTGPSSLEPPFTLEKRLFHQLHDNQIRSPTIKEFKESWAFCNAVRAFLRSSSSSRSDQKNMKDMDDVCSIDLVVDVAGGHGALAALFLILTSARRAVVIDPARVGSGSVARAWSEFFNKGNNRVKTLEYRHECLLTGLPAVLKHAILDQGMDPRRILVVACHACQHLSDEVLAIACGNFGVHAAVMPCCQRDVNGYWKSVAQKMNVPIAIVMDILLAGKVATWHVGGQQGYDVRIKVLDQSITPQNRLILCRAIGNRNSSSSSSDTILRPQDYISRNSTIDKANERLERAYRRAHDNIQPKEDENKETNHVSLVIVSATRSLNDILTLVIQRKQQLPVLIAGFCLGIFVAQTLGTRSGDRAR